MIVTNDPPFWEQRRGGGPITDEIKRRARREEIGSLQKLLLESSVMDRVDLQRLRPENRVVLKDAMMRLFELGSQPINFKNDVHREPAFVQTFELDVELRVSEIKERYEEPSSLELIGAGI